jgi:hypothetical protein
VKTPRVLSDVSAESAPVMDDALKTTTGNMGRPTDPPMQARCPICRYPLIARMTRTGPRFSCACEAIAQ